MSVDQIKERFYGRLSDEEAAVIEMFLRTDTGKIGKQLALVMTEHVSSSIGEILKARAYVMEQINLPGEKNVDQLLSLSNILNKFISECHPMWV